MRRHPFIAVTAGAVALVLSLSSCSLENTLSSEAFTRTAVPAQPPAAVEEEQAEPAVETVDIPKLGPRDEGSFEVSAWVKSSGQAVLEGIELPGCYAVETLRDSQLGVDDGAGTVAVCTSSWPSVRSSLRRELIVTGWVVSPGLEVVVARTPDASRFILVRPADDPVLGLVLVISAVPGPPLPEGADGQTS